MLPGCQAVLKPICERGRLAQPVSLQLAQALTSAMCSAGDRACSSWGKGGSISRCAARRDMVLQQCQHVLEQLRACGARAVRMQQLLRECAQHLLKCDAILQPCGHLQAHLTTCA